LNKVLAEFGLDQSFLSSFESDDEGRTQVKSASPAPSLRALAKQSRVTKKDWIASSFALRDSADAVVAGALRNDGIGATRNAGN
jgi:hypothetical protein